jgi:hypothetical protein
MDGHEGNKTHIWCFSYLVLTALFVIAAEEPPLKNDEISKLTNRHRETGNHHQDKNREGGQV